VSNYKHTLCDYGILGCYAVQSGACPTTAYGSALEVGKMPRDED